MDKPKAKADLKVVILGQGEVGKTTFITRYIDGCFAKDCAKTIGASFFLKRVGRFNVALWDTAGQEKYAGLSSFYCRGAGAAILAFDLGSRGSFEALRDRYVGLITASAQDSLKVVIGTKLDTVDSVSRQVSAEDASKLAADLNSEFLATRPNAAVPYFETSSANGTNVTAVFDYIFLHKLGDVGAVTQKSTDAAAISGRDTINLSQSADVKQRNEQAKKSCCR